MSLSLYKNKELYLSNYNRDAMKKFTIAALLLLVAFGIEAQTVVKGVVIEVLEGDIVLVHSYEGDTLSVKFNNIECPEISQSFGDKALAFTKKLSLKKEVTITYQEMDRDRNVLGTVYLGNGKDIAAELLKQGLAWHYMKGLTIGPNTGLYLELEQVAKDKKKGLWKEPNPMAPWTFRNHQNKWEGKTSI